MTTNVAETLLTSGADSAAAVLYHRESVTYGELRAKALQLGANLLAQGHSKGDRVGIYSENSPFFIYGYLGIIRAGLTAVPFPSELTVDTLNSVATDAGIRTMLVSDRFLGRLQPWADGLGVRLIKENETAAWDRPPAVHFPEIDGSRDLAALMFTSGSTGVPKGVMISHQNIERNASDIVSYMGLRGHDRVMVVLPFHYCFGLSLLHTHLMAGGSLVLNNDFKLFPETMLTELQREECTGLAGVPSTYQILLRRSQFAKLRLPHLRWLQQAGGKLPNSLIEEIVRALPQVKLFVMYGQTEATARLSYLSPEKISEKLGSIGKGLPHSKLQVLRADESPVVPGSPEVGEIVATGENIALGYWNDEAESAKIFRNRKLHTGDLARVDTDGFIFIVDRERDMIKSAGNRVSAKEIEEVIAELPAVVEVAVVGLTHEWLGEAIIAAVVPAPGAEITPEEVEAHCHRRLPRFKVPQEIHFLETMPQSGAGKILKQKLRTLLASRQLEAAQKGAEPSTGRVLVR